MKGNEIKWAEACWRRKCGRRVVRGGTWDYGPEDLRSATGTSPATRAAVTGFGWPRRSRRDS